MSQLTSHLKRPLPRLCHHGCFSYGDRLAEVFLGHFLLDLPHRLSAKYTVRTATQGCRFPEDHPAKVRRYTFYVVARDFTRSIGKHRIILWPTVLIGKDIVVSIRGTTFLHMLIVLFVLKSRSLLNVPFVRPCSKYI